METCSYSNYSEKPPANTGGKNSQNNNDNNNNKLQADQLISLCRLDVGIVIIKKENLPNSGVGSPGGQQRKIKRRRNEK